MNGYKAKALRRLAMSLHGDENNEGYLYPRGRTLTKFYLTKLGTPVRFTVSGQAVVASKAHRLYKAMKHDLRIGGQ